ncbi:MAG: hypothetical protein MUO35_11950, partial [Anaerolineales bacterium]|nr:hypothetical protein [Anaerolineales bacterium]
MTYRLGSALLLVGLIVLVVFVLGLTVQQADMRALLGGAALCALGLLLRRRAARAAGSPSRFRMLRRALGRPPGDDRTDVAYENRMPRISHRSSCSSRISHGARHRAKKLPADPGRTPPLRQPDLPATPAGNAGSTL